MNKSVMITGINGLLGQNIVQEFASDHDIYGLDLTPSIFGSVNNIHVNQLDLNDTVALEEYIRLVKPDSIINTAA